MMARLTAQNPLIYPKCKIQRTDFQLRRASVS